MGPNNGKYFFCCAKDKKNADAPCDLFLWITDLPKPIPKFNTDGSYYGQYNIGSENQNISNVSSFSGQKRKIDVTNSMNKVISKDVNKISKQDIVIPLFGKC